LKFSKDQFIRIYLLFLVVVSIASPPLATRVGIPRLDTLSAPVNLLAFAVILVWVRLPTALFRMVAIQIVVFLFGIMSLLSTPPVEALPDVMMLISPALFLALFQGGFGGLQDPEPKIRRVLALASTFVFVPVLVESISGLRFVENTSTELLNMLVLKGFFFNPNDMSSVAVLLTGTLLYFYFLCSSTVREKFIGVLLVAGLTFSVLVGGSRTASLLLVLSFVVFAYIRLSHAARIALVPLIIFGLYSVFDISWLEPLLLTAMKYPLLEFSASKLYLALFFFNQDNSISYRSEIIQFFFENFKILLYGYGPRNYGEFFSGLSNDLAATNPHAYLIEMYLAFGFFGFLASIAFLLSLTMSLLHSAADGRVEKMQRQFSLVILAIFIGVSFIPSSILRLAIIWLPLLLVSWHRITSAKRSVALTRSLVRPQTKGGPSFLTG